MFMRQTLREAFSSLLSPNYLALCCFALGKSCRSAWDQQGAALLLQTKAVPHLVSLCDASMLYRLCWLRRLLESKLWSKVSRRLQIQPWPADWRCGEDIWAGKGRKSSHLGCVLKWWAHMLMLWRKVKPLNWLISVYMGLTETDVRRHAWHFYLCSHSRTSLVPKGWERGSSAGPCLSFQ